MLELVQFFLFLTNNMAFVVTDKCINCKFTDCVEVCPVDCFHEGPNMLVINPDECIDCALCEPECPAQAITSEDELSEKELIFKEINQKYSTKWPYITEHKESPFDTEHWMSIEKDASMIKD